MKRATRHFRRTGGIGSTTTTLLEERGKDGLGKGTHGGWGSDRLPRRGFPRELSEPGEWSRAVGSGSLRPETLITVHRDGEPTMVLPARDLPELRNIFAPASEGPTVPATSPDPVENAATLPPTPPSAAPSPPRSAATPASRETQSPSTEPTERYVLPETPRIAASASGGNAVKWGLAAAIVTLLLLLLVATNLLPTNAPAVADAAAVPDVTANEAAPPDAGEAVAEGTAVTWTDTGSAKTYTTDGLSIVLSADTSGDGAVPVMTVRSAELGDGKVVGTAGGDTASATFMVLRPSRLDRVPSVLLMTYSMDAHCCTSFKLLTPRGAGWTLADLGAWDGEPWSAAPTDLDAVADLRCRRWALRRPDDRAVVPVGAPRRHAASAGRVRAARERRVRGDGRIGRADRRRGECAAVRRREPRSCGGRRLAARALPGTGDGRQLSRRVGAATGGFRRGTRLVPAGSRLCPRAHRPGPGREAGGRTAGKHPGGQRERA